MIHKEKKKKTKPRNMFTRAFSRYFNLREKNQLNNKCFKFMLSLACSQSHKSNVQSASLLGRNIDFISLPHPQGQEMKRIRRTFRESGGSQTSPAGTTSHSFSTWALAVFCTVNSLSQGPVLCIARCILHTTPP